MLPEMLLLRKALVFGAALVYWAGVLVQARRVRTRIDRSPNVRPRGTKERLLWLGWIAVILGWFGQPFLMKEPGGWFFSPIPGLLHPFGLGLGSVMVAACYAGTLWCYAALGDAWRMGIWKREKTSLVSRGPYRSVRHPIYLFQTVILGGVFFLLPTPFLFVLFGVHLVCVFIKALDEEAYLLNIHGSVYRDYLSRTGRFFPRLNSPGE